jgi:hypothetical protein
MKLTFPSEVDLPCPIAMDWESCSKFLGYKTNLGNNQGRLKRWLIYHLGVLDKFSYEKHKDISLYFRLGLIIELRIRDKHAKKTPPR